MKKEKKIFIVAITAAVLSGTTMIITGLSKGFASKFVLDGTIILFSISIFVVFLSYVVLKRKKNEETSNRE
jgi:hypothetical protein